MNACPVCGSETCSCMYINRSGDIVGCSDCLNRMEPYEVSPPENERDDRNGS